MSNKNKIISNKMFKAGGLYTIANFFNKGLIMMLTPFLTRMMSTSDFGEFSNFSTWATILIVITTLDTSNVIIRAKFDYENNYDSYIKSVSLATIVFTTVFAVITLLFNSFFSNLFGFSNKYIYALLIYLYFQPVIDYYIAQKTATVEYKSVIVVSVLATLLNFVCSIFFVFVLEDKLWGRTIGFLFAPVFCGLILYYMIFSKRSKFDLTSVFYSLKLSVPLIPHTLSNGVLSSSDRILIKRFCGSSYVAYYSVSYNVGNILYIITQSAGQAFTPWLYSKLEDKNSHNRARNANSNLAIMALVMSALFLCISPEVLYLFGGDEYLVALNLIPLIVVGVYFQFLSKLYINVEYYTKKTYLISVASVVSALCNLALNFLLIPVYGYEAAAWTTLFSFMVACFIHMAVVRKSDYRFVLNNKLIILLGAVSILLIFISRIIYLYIILRVLFLLSVIVFAFIYGKKLYSSGAMGI